MLESRLQNEDQNGTKLRFDPWAKIQRKIGLMRWIVNVIQTCFSDDTSNRSSTIIIPITTTPWPITIFTIRTTTTEDPNDDDD